MNPRQLAASIALAIPALAVSWTPSGALDPITVPLADVDRATTIVVTHPALVPSHDATINAQIAAYMLDPLFDLTPEQRNLKVIATLRQWATDARTEAAAWAGQTAAQRDSAMNTTFTRLGTFFDRFADLLTTTGLG